MLSGLGDPSRVTRDIDMVDVPVEAAINMGGLDMSNAGGAFVYQMPSGWRDRLVDLGLPLEALDVRTPSAAGLAAMKPCSGRPQDLEDVAAMLARDPGLDGELRSLLADPLEVAVNLSEEEWRDVQERLGGCEGRAGVGGGRGGAARLSWGLARRLGAREAPGGGVDLAESARAAADGRAPRLAGPLLLYAASCGRAGELLAAAPEPLRASMEGDARALEGVGLARAALAGERPPGLSRGCWKRLASWASLARAEERRASDRDADLERARRAVRLGAAAPSEAARRLGWDEARLEAVLAGAEPCSREEAASVRRAAFEAARAARARGLGADA